MGLLGEEGGNGGGRGGRERGVLIQERTGFFLPYNFSHRTLYFFLFFFFSFFSFSFSPSSLSFFFFLRFLFYFFLRFLFPLVPPTCFSFPLFSPFPLLSFFPLLFLLFYLFDMKNTSADGEEQKGRRAQTTLDSGRQ